MRPCYYCKRFDPEVKQSPWETPNPNFIGGCNGKGTQCDPDITEDDLGMFCDLFDRKESEVKA